MKKRKNRNKNSNGIQPLEYVLGPEETLMILEKGTKVSCKLVKVLINSGKGVVGMSAALFGLAKATVFINELIRRQGYDASSVYNEAREFFEIYAGTQEYQDMLDEAGL